MGNIESKILLAFILEILLHRFLQNADDPMPLDNASVGQSKGPRFIVDTTLARCLYLTGQFVTLTVLIARHNLCEIIDLI